MSKSFLRLFDYSLVPAISLVLSKIMGVYLVGFLFNIEVSMQPYADSIFSYAPQVSQDEIRIVSSYSDLFMYCVIAVLFSIVIIKAVFLHASHIKPTLVSALVNKNMLGLIYSSYEIYHAGTVALIFTWMANIIVIANMWIGNTYAWVALLVTISTLIMTTILIHDVYKEIENVKRNPGAYNWD